MSGEAALRLQPAEGTDGWCTPAALAEALGAFDLDPCSNARSHIRAELRCSLSDPDPMFRDGLEFDWLSCSTFVNPPYSDVMPWARKLVAHNGPWCALLKLDPTTKWWAELMRAAPTVAPFRRRIKFESGSGKDMTANFPSVLVYSAWRPPVALRSWLWLAGYQEAA